MKRKPFLYIGIPVLCATLYLGYIFISKPNLRELDKKIEAKSKDSEVAYPETYDSLVTYEIKNNIGFLNNDAVSCEISDNTFPYQRERFDLQQTKHILAILNDTSNYRWGEIGTPEFDKTIIYFNRDQDEIGYTRFSSEDGEAKSYPHRSLTKWGLLNPKGYKELVSAINR